ncbi:MAG: MBL fold metallo-hydrolase [Verrucomicrobiota bacterium]
MKITWLGQSGYLIELGSQRLVIDPYMSDILADKQGLRRLIPPPCSIACLSPDFLLITHDHLDHYDPETVAEIMDKFPACRLIGSESVVAHGQREGVCDGRLDCLLPGKTILLGALTITATPTRHSDSSAIGLLIRSASESLWFSGDTLYFPELATHVLQLAEQSPDIAFMCINGKLGNMNHREAAKLVSEVRSHLAIPMHYGMFRENTADPEEFRIACSSYGFPSAILKCGNPVEMEDLLNRMTRNGGALIRS